MSRAVPVVIIVLLLVWAVLATMALNKAKESNDTERAAYVDSVRADMLDRDMLIRTFYDSLAVQDHLLDSLRSIRMNPEVFHQEAAQKTDGAPLDSLINVVACRSAPVRWACVSGRIVASVCCTPPFHSLNR